MIVAAMIAAAGPAAGLPPEQRAVVECVAARAVALGRDNSAPAADVIPAANAECFAEWRKARAEESYSAAADRACARRPGAAYCAAGRSFRAMRVDSPAFRELVYGEAALALLKARAGPESAR